MLLSEFCTSVIYVKKEAKGFKPQNRHFYATLWLPLPYLQSDSKYIHFQHQLGKKRKKKWRFYAILICQFFRNVLRPHFLRF